MEKLKLSSHFECQNALRFNSSEEMSNIKNRLVLLKKIYFNIMHTYCLKKNLYNG